MAAVRDKYYALAVAISRSKENVALEGKVSFAPACAESGLHSTDIVSSEQDIPARHTYYY